MSDNTIELFLQGEGIQDIKLIRVQQDCTVRELIEKARAESGATQHWSEGMFLMAEDHDEELNLNASLKEVGIGHRSRIHCHRCRLIEVTVNFNGVGRSHAFPPSTTI